MAFSMIVPMFRSTNPKDLQQFIQKNPQLITNALQKGDILNVTLAILYKREVLFVSSHLVDYTDEYAPVSLNASLSLFETPIQANLTI